MRPLPVLMGVVNVTPDSFSDGGRWATTDAAIAHGRDLLARRCRHPRHRRRVDPARRDPAAGGGGAGARGPGDPRPRRRRARPSRSTRCAPRWPPRRSRPARAIVNDVSGGLADPRILDVVADSDATYVCMHWRAHSDRMTDFAVYDGPGGVLAAVRDELSERVDAARAAGVPDDADRARPRPGLRQATRAQLDAARGRPGAAVARLPGPGGREPQVVPRDPAGGRRRRAAPGRRPRGRDHRTDRAAGAAAGLGAAGARRAREPRRPAHLRALGQG